MKFTTIICYPTGTGLDHCVRNKEFNTDDLKEFYAYNDSFHKADGTFRSFKLQGRITLKNGERWTIGTNDATQLKKELKPFAAEISKEQVIKTKKGKEHKAVNWTYRFSITQKVRIGQAHERILVDATITLCKHPDKKASDFAQFKRSHIEVYNMRHGSGGEADWDNSFGSYDNLPAIKSGDLVLNGRESKDCPTNALCYARLILPTDLNT